MAGYGDVTQWQDDYSNSSLNQADIQDLANRTDIDDAEKSRRKKKLDEEIAAGVVGAGILGYAGYHHHEKKEGEL